MSEKMFDSNQFVMMINILSVSTKHLKDDVSELKSEEIEQRWQELLSTLHDCFEYAQSQNVDLRDYKNDLKEIMDNLYSVDKIVRSRNDGKVSIVDDIAQVVMFIATKIDDVLAGVGWKRIVRPITEAIFMIPKKIMALFSGKTETPKLLPDTIKKYLPPPMKVLPSPSNQPSIPHQKDGNKVIDVEWVDVEDNQESFASQVLRKMRDRISKQETGDNE